MASSCVRAPSCENCSDYVSRELFEDTLKSEEVHIDWLEARLGPIAQLGESNYLQAKVRG